MQFLALGNEYSIRCDANHGSTTLVAGALGTWGGEVGERSILEQSEPALQSGAR